MDRRLVHAELQEQLLFPHLISVIYRPHYDRVIAHT